MNQRSYCLTDCKTSPSHHRVRSPQTCGPTVYTSGRATTAASELVIVCIVTTIPTHAYSLFY